MTAPEPGQYAEGTIAALKLKRAALNWNTIVDKPVSSNGNLLFVCQLLYTSIKYVQPESCEWNALHKQFII